MRDQLNDGASSEHERRYTPTIHHHSNKANMKGWLWRPNDIQEPCGPKTFWHLSYRWGKTPKKPHLGNLSRPGIEPGLAAWHSRKLPPAPQRWTKVNTHNKHYIAGCIVAVAYDCGTWSLTSKGEQRLSVFENKVLRKIYGAKRDEIIGEWRKLHNSQLHALYSL